MKTPSLLVALAILTVCLGNTASCRVVTLTLGGAKTNDSITLGTNEVVTVITGEGRGVVTWEKDGLSFGNIDSSYYFAQEFNPATAYAGTTHQPYKLVIGGPAKLNFQRGPGSGTDPSYLTIQLDSDQFPPDKTVIVPEGTGANIILESSTNLINWSPASPGLYTNRIGNLFFRIRADRLP